MSARDTFTLHQLTFSSLQLMLSIAKEGSFLCRDARIKTRDLEYRNQTLSVRSLLGLCIALFLMISVRRACRTVHSLRQELERLD